MKSNLALTADQMKRAVESVKKIRLAYTDMLDFYARIFDAQTESRNRIQIEPLQITEEMISIKAREKLSLIDIREFVYDENESGRLFFTICSLAKKANPKLAASAEVLLNGADTAIEPKALFAGLLEGDEALFENITVELKIDKQVLGFITYNSIKPSLTACADQLSAYLSKNEPWLKGYCPICGSAPILSMLEGEGARSLICSFCWHEWSVKRGFCPFCENRNNKTQQYFYNEEEKEYRVDLCDNCKKYLKTIDTRKADRLIYPPLEQISTLHLDIKAKEMGFESGIQLFMQI
jgi:FdhE protein